METCKICRYRVDIHQPMQLLDQRINACRIWSRTSGLMITRNSGVTDPSPPEQNGHG